ncbi:aminotransferase class III-fold pyridoxal phosphate-dependent enzyme, partial [Thauera propionica]|uniref:aminotransferase class III-fold pyridoxal phosphate-dependent enzyme n=1 Tax=Thauera propionica TaxID=2019431 RepID=UPI0023F47FB7
LDAISVGGEAIFRRGLGPLLPGTEHVPACNPGNCVFGCGGHCTLRCVDYIDHCLSREGDVAAVIVETVRSTDVRFPPVEYYAKLRQICDHHGTLLILDEIPLAFGRTGPMFAIEHYGIEPDMILVGKGLGGGTMPLAALIARGDYNVAAETALGHYTHEKSPVACAAGLALLEAIEEENLLERSRVLGQHAIDLLRRNTAAFDSVTEIRGAGLLIGVELSHPDLAEKVLYRCLAHGLSFKVGQGRVLVLAPPLTIGEQELELAIDIVTEAIAFEEES